MTPPPPISATLLRFFRTIVRRYFRRHFHAVRLSLATDLATDPATLTGPLIVIGNHGSWWDPMVAFLLAEELFPNRPHYAPMDSAALQRYRILEKLGIFPIDMNTPRGAAQFLRTGASILASGGVLWITPQGRFTDPRARPLAFKPGLAALASRTAAQHGSCTILPLAIEYPFWNERLPECLLRIGQPLIVRQDNSPEVVDSTSRAALTAEMDTLAQLAIPRNPLPFHTIVKGSSGTGGLYATAMKIKAIFLRKPYIPDHTPDPHPPNNPLSPPTNSLSFRPYLELAEGVAEKPASAPAHAVPSPSPTNTLSFRPDPELAEGAVEKPASTPAQGLPLPPSTNALSFRPERSEVEKPASTPAQGLRPQPTKTLSFRPERSGAEKPASAPPIPMAPPTNPCSSP